MELKEIKNINNCTLVDILKCCEKVVQQNYRTMLRILFNSEAEEIEEIINANLVNQSNKDKTKLKILYDVIKMKNMNDNHDKKVMTLMRIYYTFKKEYSPAEIQHMKNLILGDREFIFTIDIGEGEKNEGEYIYDILMKEPQKTLKNIYNEELRGVIKDSIDDIVSMKDLVNIVKYEGLSDAIVRKLAIELCDKHGVDKIVRKGKRRIVDDELIERLDNRRHIVEELIEKDKNIDKEFETDLKNYLKDNLQYIDINRLLINAATRLITGIEIYKGKQIGDICLGRTGGEKDRDEDREKGSIDTIRIIYAELSRNSDNKTLTQTIYSKTGEELVKVDLDTIKLFLSRCTSKEYVNENEIKTIHEQIKSGILIEDVEKRKIANINKEDLVTLSKEYNALEESEDFNEKQQRMKMCSKQLIEYLKENQKLQDTDLVEMYIDGELNLDFLMDTNLEEISEEYFIKEFKTLYEEVIKDKDEEKISKLKRFSNLYNKLSEDGKVDKLDLLFDITETYTDKDILELYNLEIITIEEGIECLGTDILDKIFESEDRKFQPNEIRNLYYNNKVDINKLTDLVKRIPTPEERYLIVLNIFPEKEDSEIRNELIERTIEVDSSISSSNQKQTKKQGQRTDEKEYKIHITDSSCRFELIRSLDKNYFMEMTNDGHVILTLKRFGKVIIEKLLDKNKQEGYGAATYILDEEYYKVHEDEIYVDKRIDRSRLVKAHRQGEVVKIHHNIKTWGKRIKDYFINVSETQYDLSDLEKIDDIISRIRESEKIVGE